jgi:hypothetical protein
MVKPEAPPSGINPEAKAEFEELFDSLRAQPPVASFDIPDSDEPSEFAKRFFGIK